MFKSRVHLGPRLIAQTHRNPHFQLHWYTYLKFGVAAFLLAVGGLAVKAWQQSATTGSALPQTPQVLGIQKEIPQPLPYYLYKVQTHDSLFSISEKFQINWDTIATLNNLKEPFDLTPSQKLQLPITAATKQQQLYDNLQNKIYMVEAGDSFSSIAVRLNLSVNELLRANPQLKPDNLKAGQTLQLP